MKRIKDQKLDSALQKYFKSAQKQKPSASFKQDLYEKLEINSSSSFSLFGSASAATAALAVVLVVSLNLNYNKNDKENSPLNSDLNLSAKHEHEVAQAQQELNLALHYINKLTYKTMSSVKSKGIQPAIIKPVAKSLAKI